MQVCFLFAFAEYDLLGIIQHHRLLQKSHDQRRQKGEVIPTNKHLMPESLVSQPPRPAGQPARATVAGALRDNVGFLTASMPGLVC